MKIAVCVKQVPNTLEIKIDKETGTLIRDNVPAVLNPFDEYAVEEAVRIKEQLGGSVTAITMGPLQAKEVLYDAYALGADQGVHLCDFAVRGSDTYATALTLAAAIEKLGSVDLILCGKQAIDGDTAQVGPEIAELLNMPHVSYVKRIREVRADSLLLERLVEIGIEVVEVQLPAVLTVLKDINVPRLPSLKLKLAGKAADTPTWGIAELGIEAERVGLAGSPTTVLRTFTPEARCNCQMLCGVEDDILCSLLCAIDEAL